MATLRQRVGQMFMVGLSGAELSAAEKTHFSSCHFGGVIFFSHNLKEPEQILTLCRTLWQQWGSELPPFIAIDQEGGRVHRLPPPFTHFPPAAALGRARSRELAYRFGLATARELSAVGINLNFAPVLDVLSNPSNPIIGDRSLGSEPSEVTALGSRIVEGLRSGGVIPCGKHFPGHGDTEKDSHLELPVVKKTKRELEGVELPPFVSSARNQIESIMTAHVLYPALDPQFPATLSCPVIDGLLRSELAYDGVVFGDDLEMKAITGHYSLEETVALAVKAGVDVLMFCHDAEAAIQAFGFLCEMAEKDNQIRSRVNESFARIENLKKRYLGAFAGGDDTWKEIIGAAVHLEILNEIRAFAV